MAEFGWRRLRQRRYAREVRDKVASGSEVATFGSAAPVRGKRSLSLPSEDEGLHFDASVHFEARWIGTEPAPPSLLDIALEGISRRAEGASRRRTLTEAERLRGELNTTLLRWEPVPGTAVHARGHCVSIDVDVEYVAAVEAREAAIRRQTVVSWQSHQRRHQEEQMCSLLLDPLRATAWWLLDNRENPEQLVAIAQTFQELRGILASEKRPDTAGQLLDELLETSDEAVRTRLVSLLQKAFTEYGREELTARLKECEEKNALGTNF